VHRIRRGVLAPIDLLLGALLFVLARDVGRLRAGTPRRCGQEIGQRAAPFINWIPKGGGYVQVNSFRNPDDQFPLGVPISQIEASTSSDSWADLDDGHLQPGDVLLRADLWDTRAVVPGYGEAATGREATGWTFVVARGGARHTYHVANECFPLPDPPPTPAGAGARTGS